MNITSARPRRKPKKKKNMDAVRMAKLRAKKLSRKRRVEIARMGAAVSNAKQKAAREAKLEQSAGKI